MDANALFDALDSSHSGVITHEDVDRMQAANSIPADVAEHIRSSLGPRQASPSTIIPGTSILGNLAPTVIPGTSALGPGTYQPQKQFAPPSSMALTPGGAAAVAAVYVDTPTPPGTMLPGTMLPTPPGTMLGTPPAATLQPSYGAPMYGVPPEGSMIAAAPQSQLPMMPQAGPPLQHTVFASTAYAPEMFNIPANTAQPPVVTRFNIPADTAQPPVVASSGLPQMSYIPADTAQPRDAIGALSAVPVLPSGQQQYAPQQYAPPMPQQQQMQADPGAPDAPNCITLLDVFTLMDRDSDGQVSRDDFIKWIQDYQAGRLALKVQKPEAAEEAVTDLAQSAEEGSDQIIVSNTCNLKAGDIIYISGDALQVKELGTACDFTTVLLQEPLTKSYPEGAAVKKDKELVYVPGVDPSYEELFVYRDMDGELTGAGAEVFAMIDKDCNGLITREEFLTAFAGNKRLTLNDGDINWNELLGEVDVDVDVDIDMGEYDANAPDVDITGPDINFQGDFNLKGPSANIHLGHHKFHPGHMHGGINGDFEGGQLSVDGGLHFDDCCTRFVDRCELGCDRCETCCCMPCMYSMATCVGFNLKAHESIAQRLAPWFYTLLCFILFASPIGHTYSLSQDMQVRYWITDRLAVVLLLPALYAAVQFWQAANCRIMRPLVGLSLIGSCVFLFFLGDMAILRSAKVENSLVSQDCETDLEKHKIQIQWQNAYLFYQQCMEKTFEQTGTSLEVSYGLYRIQDCAGYTDQLYANPAWPYLGQLEEKYNCGGWCKRGQPLWTFKPVKDSCSTTVADVLSNRVQFGMSQVLLYMLLVVIFCSLVLIQAGPIMRSHGIKW